MSYNPNFYNNRFTFQNQNNFAPNLAPPPPPRQQRPFIIPRVPKPALPISDQDFVKRFEKSIHNTAHLKNKTVTISEAKEQLQKMVHNLNTLKDKENIIKEKMNTLSEENWTIALSEIDQLKNQIAETMSTINSNYVDLQQLLAKRTAKRLRQKKVKKEQQQEKKIRFKEMEEKSRKIDENLQKIRDDIEKAKQEEKSKRLADIVLRETLRKKSDAKRCIVKLDALMKLRKARQNTAKGRGECPPDSDTESFNGNIEKLKSLWTLKLASYEKEEAESRAKLQDGGPSPAGETERETLANLALWREVLFGSDALPQVDFKGDAWAFIHARHQWDRYLSNEGSPLPIGWVTPIPNTLTNNTHT